MTYDYGVSDHPGLARLREAFEAGEAAAQTLAVGERFDGAWGTARRLGFFEPPIVRTFFSEAYLATLAARKIKISCDENGTILEIRHD